MFVNASIFYGLIIYTKSVFLCWFIFINRSWTHSP